MVYPSGTIKRVVLCVVLVLESGHKGNEDLHGQTNQVCGYDSEVLNSNSVSSVLLE